MKGLVDGKLVFWLINERKPVDYLEAIEVVGRFESRQYLTGVSHHQWSAHPVSYRRVHGYLGPYKSEEAT